MTLCQPLPLQELTYGNYLHVFDTVYLFYLFIIYDFWLTKSLYFMLLWDDMTEYQNINQFTH